MSDIDNSKKNNGLSERSADGAVKLSGIILKGVGGLYTVEAEGDGKSFLINCRVRGSLKADWTQKGAAAESELPERHGRRGQFSRSADAFHAESRLLRPLAGDRVGILLSSASADGAEGAVIEEIKSRKNALIRPPVANLTHIFIICAAARPDTVVSTVDKLISISEHNGIEPVIVISKTDLSEEKTAWLSLVYQKAGYEVFSVSCETDDGIARLSDYIVKALPGGIAAFAGASGAGKSTLLNRLFPELSLKTGGVSEKIGRGRHTTREATLFALPSGGYIADTPGFSLLDFENFDFFDIDALPGTMREFKKYYGCCRYADCTHTKEEGCAVLGAVERGEIAKERHESYLEMYTVLKAKPKWGNK